MTNKKMNNSIPWKMLFADDLVVIAETENDLIKGNGMNVSSGTGSPGLSRTNSTEP